MTREEIRSGLSALATQFNPFSEESKLILGAVEALEQEPCEDAVSRQGLLDAFGLSEKTRKYGGDHSGYDTMMLYEIQNVIESAESANPQLKMGRWIAQDIHNCHTDFKCSECGYIHSFMHLYGKPTADYTYCPNCGAKMSKIPTGSEPQERSE